jgi:hypothetical protein
LAPEIPHVDHDHDHDHLHSPHGKDVSHAEPCRPDCRPRASPSRSSLYRTRHGHGHGQHRSRLSSPRRSSDVRRSCPRCRTTRAPTARRYGAVAGRRLGKARRADAARRASMPTARCRPGLRAARRRCPSRSRRGGGGSTIRACNETVPGTEREVHETADTRAQVQGRNVAHQPRPDTVVDRPRPAGPLAAHHDARAAQVAVLARRQTPWREAASKSEQHPRPASRSTA